MVKGRRAELANPTPSADEISLPPHSVQFYDCEASLLDAMDRFIGPALGAGEAAVVVATKGHRDGLVERLRARGLSAALAEERYVSFDAAESLSKFMVDGCPDESRFVDVVGGAIARAAASNPRGHVRLFGEMATLLYAWGESDAAVSLEVLWNDVARTLPFSPVCLCAYPTDIFRGKTHTEPFLRVISAHSHVYHSESYSTLATAEDRLRVIAELHQKANSLEGEVGAANEAKAWFTAIVESTDDAVIGKTLDGIVTSWNPAAERIFGYKAEEMIGQPIAHLIPPERQGDFGRILGSIRRGERVSHFETERVRKDGSRVHVSLTVSPVRDPTGRIIGASKIARDVTDRKRAEAEREELFRTVERSRAEVEAANRAKDEFLAMLGHELRNPLSAIRNALVAAQLDPSRRDRAHQLMSRQADQLARLIDDLLDVARIEQGKLILRKRRVDFASIVEQALETTRPMIEERTHKVTVSLPQSEVRIEADPARLEQVFINVISNAAKYTEPGGRIDVTAEVENGEIVLRVRDSGIGISPHMLGRVFDIFTQADKAADRKSGGLGIGLTVVRRLVELHGGRVEAHSEGLGKGTEVEVRLPIVSGGRDAAAGVSQAGVVYRGQTRVLLVEDDGEVAESMVALLEVLGHHVRVASDGLSALDVANLKPPDVMLIDVGLPDIDGYEVARRVRQDPKLGRVVLVALTGYGRDEDKHKAMSAGFDHHLTKPIEVSELQRLVTRLSREETEPGEQTTSH
jgi:PAS domain S-box-containing protein